LAHQADRFKKLNQNIIAIAFLGTPHRGTDLAKVLKTLLRISFSETRFVRDLSPNSQTIKDINEAFGERSKGLELASFYEGTGMPIVGVLISYDPLSSILILCRL